MLLFMQELPWDWSLAPERAGRSLAARMAMIAMTTRSSMSVKPRRKEGLPVRHRNQNFVSGGGLRISVKHKNFSSVMLFLFAAMH